MKGILNALKKEKKKESLWNTNLKLLMSQKCKNSSRALRRQPPPPPQKIYFT